MKLFFFFEGDLSFYVFLYFFFGTFLYFFISYIVDLLQLEENLSYFFCLKNKYMLLKTVLPSKNFPLVYFPVVVRFDFLFLMFCLFLNLIVFFSFYCNIGGCGVVVCSSRMLQFNISSVCCFFLLNFFFIFLLVVFYKTFFSNAFKNSYDYFFYKKNELIIFYFINLVSFFFSFCNDFISFFIAIEFFSFTMYMYTTFYGVLRPELNKIKISFIFSSSMEAAVKYLVPNLIASSFFLLGIFFIYFSTGLFFFDDVFLFIGYFKYALLNDGLYQLNVLFFGFLSIVLGFCIKLSVAPLHSWVIWVYSGLVQHILFFLSILSKLFYFIIFVKKIIFFLVFFFNEKFSIIFLFLSFMSMIYSTYQGVFEVRFNFILAYSGILNIGYSFLALSLGTFHGVLLAFYIYVIYLFLTLLLISILLGLRNFAGLFYINNVEDFNVFSIFGIKFYFIFILLFFSIIGMPPLLGFYPKFLLFLNVFCFKPRVFCMFFLFLVVISSFIYFKILSKINLGFYKFENFFYFLNYKFINVFYLYLVFFFFSSFPLFSDLLLFFFETCLCLCLF